LGRKWKEKIKGNNGKIIWEIEEKEWELERN
jgi:hypothetical protein